MTLYLRQDIQVEPLVDQWYAWSQLIPPAAAARTLTEHQLPIIDSYLAAPHVHAAAVRDPRMLGGPFIDYGGARADEIRALRDRTVAARARYLSLSRALGQLDQLLRSAANGYSLQPLYAQVPHELRGCVELTYDVHNQPSFRLIEPLLYRRYYDSSAQSLWLSVTTGDDRPFVMSTPRLPQPDHLHLELAYADERVDALFRLKTQGRSLAEIHDLFQLPSDRACVLDACFTETPPPRYTPYGGDGLRWRYFGHACVLVETNGLAILFDPVLSYTYDSAISRYTYLDLPETIDYVVITHNHIDHLLFETLLQLRHKTRQIIVPKNLPGALPDPSMALMLKHCGFTNVLEMGELDVITEGDLSVTALPFLGEHGDLAVASKLAYHVRAGARTLLFVADSCNLEPRLYRDLHAMLGDVDVLFVGMECSGAPVSWMYGSLFLRPLPRAMDESRRLSGSNCAQALDIVETFNCRHVYVYAMGQEPWLTYVMSIKYTDESLPIVESNRLIETCRHRGIVCERLFAEKEVRLDRPAVAALPT